MILREGKLNSMLFLFFILRDFVLHVYIIKNSYFILLSIYKNK